jgi:phosphatidate phosphatase APP1
VNLLLPFRRRRPTVSREEAVLFYPSYGYRDGDDWRMVIQAWVYRPRITWLRRKPMLGLIRRAMRVDRSSEEFHRRMRQFLVNSSVGRMVRVQSGDAEIVVGPSEVAGLISGELTLSQSAVRIIREESTPHVRWAEFQAVLPNGDSREFRGKAQLLEERGVSIVSDVDDTLKHSNVPNRRDLFRNTFERAFVPIRGMPELYRACALRGAAFHYVSASPWQLYESLAEFWNDQGYPQGSFHLKRFRLRDSARKLKMSPQKAYKRSAIEPILDAYPHRRFMLVGDSGEQDPEIYASLWRERPQQIAHVWIRTIRGRTQEQSRLRRTFADCPADVWSYYDHPSEMADGFLTVLDRLLAETPASV